VTADDAAKRRLVTHGPRAACALLCMGRALGSAAPPAAADADPASDYLVMQDAFFPYSTAVSKPLTDRLVGLLASARKQGLPIKVALIGATSDLGAVPTAFGHPEVYARFLGTEITFNGKRPQLVVVMPKGLGTFGLTPKAARAVRQVPPPTGSAGDALATQAVVAVQKVAAASGHHLTAVKGSGATSGRRSGGGPSAAVFLAPVLLLVVAAGATTMISRRRAGTAGRDRSR
jgi:hypothetical protein